MQFDHPHAFRGEVCDALIDKVPDVFDAALAAGAEIGTVAELTGVKVRLQGRRVTFERELGRAAQLQPGVTFRAGNWDTAWSAQGAAAIVAPTTDDIPGRLARADRPESQHQREGPQLDPRRPLGLPQDLLGRIGLRPPDGRRSLAAASH
jgi:hypothetical protein